MDQGLSIPPRIGENVGAYVVNVQEWLAQLGSAADATYQLVAGELGIVIASTTGVSW